MTIQLVDSSQEFPLLRKIFDFFSSNYIAGSFNPLGTAERFMEEYPEEDEGKILFETPTLFEDELQVDHTKGIECGMYQNLCTFIGELKGFAGLKYVRNKRGWIRHAIPPAGSF